MSLNLGDLSASASKLGNDLLAGLQSGLLAHITDPIQVDLLSRNTAKIAAGGLALVSPLAEVVVQAQEDINAGYAVILSLASAGVEDAAGLAREELAKLGAFVTEFLTVAITAAIKAIPVLAIA